MTNVQWQATLNDDATTEDTLHSIVAMVNANKATPYVQLDAVPIIQEEADAKGISFCEMLCMWCANDIDYKLDKMGIEVIKTPDLTTLDAVADCKKFSILQGSVLAAAGYEPIFKHVEYANDTKWTHIYVIVPLADFDPDTRSTYIVLDPTNNKQFNSEVQYKSASLWFLNGDTMKLVAMGNSQVGKPNYGHDIIGQMGWAGGNVIDHMNWGGMGAASQNVLQGQQWVALLSLVSQNIGGLADAFIGDFNNGVDMFTGMASEFNGDPNELKEAALTGSNIQPMAVKGSGVKTIRGLSTRWSGVGAGLMLAPVVPGSSSGATTTPQVFPSQYPKAPTQVTTIYTAANTGKPFTNAGGTENNLQQLQTYQMCYNNGQDYNGYYGWIDWSTGTPNYWTGADADAEFRNFYTNAATWWGGEANILPNLPIPLAKGAAKHGTAPQTTLQVLGPFIAAAAGAAANAAAPGTGSLVSGAVGGLIDATGSSPSGSGTSIPPPQNFPPSTSPPSKTSVAGSIGGFFFKGMLCTIALPHTQALVFSIVVPVITLALLTRKFIYHVNRKNHRNA